MSKPVAVGPEEVVFSGKMLEVVHQKMDVSGKEVVFERARRAPGVRLIIPSKDGRSLLITTEHRTEIGKDDHRLPGGKVFDSLEEFRAAREANVDMKAAAREAAKRELREETGLLSDTFTLLHVSHAGATVEWDLYYFLVKDFSESDEGQQLEGGEVITLNWLAKDTVRKRCHNGDISEDRSVAALLRYLHTA